MSKGNGRIIVEIKPRGQNIKGLVLKCNSREDHEDPVNYNVYCSNAIKNTRGYYISKTTTPILPAYVAGSGTLGIYDIYSCIDSNKIDAWRIDLYNPSRIYANKITDSLRQIVTTTTLKTGIALTFINDTAVRGSLRAYPTYLKFKGPETKNLFIPANDPRWYVPYPGQTQEAQKTKGNTFTSLKTGTYELSYVQRFNEENKTYTTLDTIVVTRNTLVLKAYYFNSPNHIQMTMRPIQW